MFVSSPYELLNSDARRPSPRSLPDAKKKKEGTISGAQTEQHVSELMVIHVPQGPQRLHSVKAMSPWATLLQRGPKKERKLQPVTNGNLTDSTGTGECRLRRISPDDLAPRRRHNKWVDQGNKSPSHKLSIGSGERPQTRTVQHNAKGASKKYGLLSKPS